LLPSIHTLENPVAHVVAKLNSVGAISDQRQQLALNAAARGLLDHHVSKDVSKGWRYAALTGIEAVCKTFDLAPTESERALISLVTPQRLAHFPHKDLFELAHQIKHLKSSGENVVLRLFEAAFSAGPKPGDWQNFGGAIMPMRMQTSDHWNSIHYSLAGYYEERDGTNAALMTELACIAWSAVVCRRTAKHNPHDDVLATMPFRGVMCELVANHDQFWQRSYEAEKIGSSCVLSAFFATGPLKVMATEWLPHSTGSPTATAHRCCGRCSWRWARSIP
jgi:hypothetical protein